MTDGGPAVDASPTVTWRRVAITLQLSTMKPVPMKVASIVAVFAWWVIVNLQAILGPYGNISQCASAAAEYAKAHNVVATCQRDN